MKVELELWSSREVTLVGEVILAIAKIRAEQEALSASQVAVAAADFAEAVGEVGEVKKERKPRAKKEATEVTQVVAVEIPKTLPEPTPAPTPEPATAPVSAPVVAPAAPAFTKVALEDKVRALAKTNFAAVKALLASYNVERFGKLGEDQYPTFGPKLFALPEYPEPAVA